MFRYFDITENGHTVRCKLYFQDLNKVRRVVIFGHGFGGHKDNGAAEKFANRLITNHPDCGMITFNWPGHGDDEKKGLHLEDCSVYLEIVVAYIRQSFHTEELYSYATSFGGYLTLKYISEHGNPFRKIALRCPAVNMYDVLTTAIMTEEELARVQMNEEAAVGFDRKILIDLSLLKDLQTNDIQKRNYRKCAENLLILHGTDDEIVPFAAARAFAERNLIAFVPVDGADHRFQDEKKMEQAIDCILDCYAL